MSRSASPLCLCLVLVVAFASVAHAQGVQTATLVGVVTDGEAIPLPGVTVSATSPAMLGERTTLTEVNGDYILRGLLPGDYRVRFVLDGMVTVEATVSLSLGVTSRANATLKPMVIEETISVTAEAPAALETLTVGTNINAQTVDQLPIIARGPIGIGSLAASVNDRTQVINQLSINGGMGYDNSIMINGVNVQDPLFGNPNNLFIEDAILETQVLTSGISAEYGGFTGGVVNAITKSGGNDFSGSLRANYSRPQWRDETPFEDERGVKREGDLSRNYAATLGGRIIRDRLWFFAAGRDEDMSLPIQIPLTGVNLPRVISNRRYELKLTSNVTPRHTLQASYIDNPVKFPVNGNVLEAAALTFDSSTENEGFVVGYAGTLSDSWFAEARYSWKKFEFAGLGGRSTDIRDSPFQSNTRFAGNIAGTFNGTPGDVNDPESRDNEQLAASLSYFWSNERLGSHDLKIGAERFMVTHQAGLPLSPTNFLFNTGYLTAGGRPVFDAEGRLIPVFNSAANGRRADESRLTRAFSTRGAALDITTDSFFVNDHWNLGERWKVTAGVRHERVRSEATGGIEAIDTDATVPRLGISFDPLANGKYKLNVTYGQYAGRYNPAIVADNSPVLNPATLYGYYVGPSGSGRNFAPGFDPNNYVFYFARVPTQNTFIEDGLSSPINEELSFSAGMALPHGGYLEATYVQRDLHDAIDDFVTIDSGCTTVVLAGVTGNCFDNIVDRNTDALERQYKGLSLQGRYNLMPRWTIEGNYTYQLENDGNYDGETGGIALTAHGNYPEMLSPQTNPFGRLALYQEHRVRLWSTYSVDLGRAGTLGGGLLYRYDSPRTFNFSAQVPLSAAQRAANPGYQNPPTFQTLFFGERGAGEFSSSSLFDLSLSYGLPIFSNLETWIKLDVVNLFNADTLVTYNTTILANTGNQCGGPCPVDGLGLPTTFRPGPLFGQATGATNYVTPREYFIAVGLRF